MKEKVLLIDGNSLLFRAYHATAYSGPRMTTSDGVSTNAVYAFINMFNKVIKLINPTHVMVAWDAGKPTFRHQKFEEYKGTRKPIDPELKEQFPIVREFLDAYGIFRYEEEGIEADDIIGSLSQKFSENCYILTGDNDLVQLVSPTSKVLLMKSGISEMIEINIDNIKELKGVTYPWQIIDMKGLMGDKSDNIPGIPGIGEKTALKLLDKYKSVEGVYEHIDELKGKQKEKIENNKDLAFISKELATIKCDCDIPCTIDDIEYSCDQLALNTFFKKYEMNSFIKRGESAHKKIKLQKVNKIPSDFLKQPLGVFIDCDNELFYNQQLYGIAFFDKEKILYVDADNIDKNIENYLCDDAYDKMGFGVKEIYHLLNNYNIKFKPFKFDVKIASFLLDNSTNSLLKLSDKYELNYNLDKDEIFGKIGGKRKEVSDEIRINFVEEACNTLIVAYPQIKEKLDKEEMEQCFYDIEMPISYILYEMETNGVRVDLDVLKQISRETQAKVDLLEQEIWKLAGEEFNISSPKQLAHILFDELGLKEIKKRSTAVEVLEKLVDEHPIINKIMDHRRLSKLNNTYALGLQKYILADGRIHGLFHQNLVQTGRLSSSDPNLQNLSVRDVEAREIRKSFIASEDHILYGVDYSQIELRVLAHMAHEDNMIEAFNHGIDIHTKTAMEIFKCDKNEVTDLMRRQAKCVNFGMVYGQGVYGLSNELNISFNEAKKFIDTYFESYPNIRQFMEEQVAFCEQHGYVETMFKRRRYINDINSANHNKKEFAKRASMNAPIQGSASEIIKLAMIKINEMMKEKQVQSKLIMQIHDELVFDCLNSEKELMEKIIKKGMLEAVSLIVPLEFDGNFADNYYGCK